MRRSYLQKHSTNQSHVHNKFENNPNLSNSTFPHTTHSYTHNTQAHNTLTRFTILHDLPSSLILHYLHKHTFYITPSSSFSKNPAATRTIHRTSHTFTYSTPTLYWTLALSATFPHTMHSSFKQKHKHHHSYTIFMSLHTLHTLALLLFSRHSHTHSLYTLSFMHHFHISPPSHHYNTHRFTHCTSISQLHSSHTYITHNNFTTHIHELHS